MKMRYFQSSQIADGITQIEDLCGTKFYLVEGSECAALLDCGAGLGNIGEYIKTLTDKPLIVLLTHGHVDHAMGGGTFPEEIPIYLNPADYEIYKRHSDLSMRKGYYRSMRLIYDGLTSLLWKTDALEWVSPASVERFLPLNSGDSFDLGDETVEICPGAGHTPGCVTVLLHNHRILLLGDAINNGTFLFDETALPISEYKKTLQALDEKTVGRYDQVLFCHGAPKKHGFGDVNMIKGGIWLCDAILEGRDMHISRKMNGTMCYMAKPFLQKKDIGDKSECNIIYSIHTLR